MTTNRDAIIARIRALLAKTTEKGATEAEALAAVAKARELMDKYQLDIGAASVKDEGVAHKQAPRQRKHTMHGAMEEFDVAFNLAGPIGRFSGTHIWRDNTVRGGQFQILGPMSDVEFAEWLMDTLPSFVVNGAKGYADLEALNSPYPIKQIELDFARAATKRIRERLFDLISFRDAHMESSTTGREIVLVKNALTKEAFDALGIKLKFSEPNLNSRVDFAAAAGRAHGDRASFGRPVDGKGPVTLRIAK